MNHRFRKLLVCALAASTLAVGPSTVYAYPLDGYASTGIGRLEYQRLVQLGEIPGIKRAAGELLPLSMVDIRLRDRADMTLPAPDPKLTERLKKLLGPDVERYGIALLDWSDRDNPRYAEWHGNQQQNPGSVGKLMVALATFQVLADLYPDDIEARKRILRSTMITADVFSVSDLHTVPFWKPETRTVEKRPLQQGDTATLWTYLDWMMSPSSNSAAAMLEKNLITMKHFGAGYPVSAEQEAAFFEQTPKEGAQRDLPRRDHQPGHPQRSRYRRAAPGELLYPSGQNPGSRHVELCDTPRAGTVPVEARTGKARR